MTDDTAPGTAQTDWAEQLQFSEFVRAGDLVFVSGQVGMDGDGTPPADPAAQYKLAFGALADVLAKAGLTPVDIVDLTTFHTSYPEHMGEFLAAKAEFQGAARPAWTAIGVASLGTPGTLVEIKAVAYAPR